MNDNNKVITLCPTCLRPINEVNSTVHCPKVNGAAVCMTHCYTLCRYLENSMSLTHCTYRDAKRREKEGGAHKKTAYIHY